MGTKPAWKRKYFFLHFACIGLLLSFIFGCLHFSEQRQGQKLLDDGIDHLGSRQFEASRAKSLTVLNRFPLGLADRALFQLGLLYAHPENPDRDYNKSLGYFNKIISEFSQSRLRSQAQLWVLIIRDDINKERKIGKLNKKKVSLQKTIELQKIEISNLQEKIKTEKNVDLIVFLEKKVDEQKKEINELLDQIEKLKRVDLGIEEKKQKILQQNEDIEESTNEQNSGS